MKLVATVHDFGAAANIGGNVKAQSAIIEIPDCNIPLIVSQHLKDPKWSTLSFSILVDQPDGLERGEL